MNAPILKLALAVSFALCSHVVFAAENKVALVIGNANYKEARLKNPINDAKDMKTALEKVGFKVIYMENATFDQMDELRKEFRKSLNQNSIGLFYYSGHGVQADGVNYLIPINAKIEAKADLVRRAYDLGYFLDDMSEASNQANIIILDACRDNPFKSVRSVGNSKGLASSTDTPRGSIIAYATAPNSVADDNPTGKNGIYTKYLKQYLFKPGLTIESAFKEVRKAVLKETSQEQIPWENSSLTGDICLAGCSSSGGSTKPPVISENVTASPPLLSFVSGSATVNQNKIYTFKVKANDADKDLSLVQIDWGDGSELEEKAAKNNGILSFTHSYQFAGIYPLIALALDNAGNVSNEVTKSVSVKGSAAVTVKIPRLILSDISKTAFELGDSVVFSATLSSALPNGYSVKVDYGNGLVNMDSVSNRTSFSISAKPSNSAMYHIGIYDKAGKLQGSQASGSFEVTQPHSESAPILRLVSASDSIEKNKLYSVSLQASDADNNLDSVAIDWGDGKQDVQDITDNSTAIFNHVYENSGKYSWSAVAYDAAGLSSETLSQNVTVNAPAVVAVVVPTLKQVVASPSSATQGNSVTFSAALSSALPSGFSVKADTGNGWYAMTGSGTNYNLAQNPATLGLQTFKVGIFDNVGTLKGLAMTGTFEVTKLNNAPTLSLISGADSATAGTAYSLQLQASDIDGNLSHVQISNWGDGGSDSQNASNGTNLSFSHTFNSAGTYTISAMAYDLAGTTSKAISKTVTVSKAVVVAPVDNSGSSSSSNAYTKIANNGSTLSDSAKLGTGAKDWACTKDNNTGLIWEVKTDDGGLRDKDWGYSWYEPDASKNGGFEGNKNSYPEDCKGSECDTYAFTNAVNTQGLCGAKDWRMPTIDELKGIVKSGVTNPSIDTTYFPNTKSDLFWSSSPYANSSNHAWYVVFYDGYSNGNFKENGGGFVRLVRGGGQFELPLSTLTIELADMMSLAANGAPLKDNPYWGFRFSYKDKEQTVVSDAIGDAQTYTELLIAVRDAIAANPELAGISVELSSEIILADTRTGKPVKILPLILKSSVGKLGIKGATWLPNEGVPSISSLHTRMYSELSIFITPTNSKVTAVEGDFATFNIASGNYDVVISGFKAGNKLKFFADAIINVVRDTDQTDGIQQLTVQALQDRLGMITKITLTGLTAEQDVNLFNVASINNVFGAGTVQFQ
jgi:hypothetical protein